MGALTTHSFLYIPHFRFIKLKTKLCLLFRAAYKYFLDLFSYNWTCITEKNDSGRIFLTSKSICRMQSDFELCRRLYFWLKGKLNSYLSFFSLIFILNVCEFAGIFQIFFLFARGNRHLTHISTPTFVDIQFSRSIYLCARMMCSLNRKKIMVELQIPIGWTNYYENIIGQSTSPLHSAQFAF